MTFLMLILICAHCHCTDARSLSGGRENNFLSEKEKNKEK